VITAENLAVKVKPNKLEGMTELEGISDSKYGADHETQIGVFGWNLYFCSALISWRSKASNCVTLSLTEAEYI
jgi:hypothetical protein